MSEPIVIVKDNGSLVGSDGDSLYDGVRVQVGYDELTVATQVALDGLSFTRTTSLPGGAVHSASTVTYDGFAEGARARIVAGLTSTLGQAPTEEQIVDGLESAWEVEKQIAAHSKVFVDALVDGELVQVEKKITYIEWTAR